MSSMQELRERLVRDQVEARGVRDPLVLAAIRAVRRELFVPKNLRKEAYDDTPLPIGADQTISQPYIVAFMVEAMTLRGRYPAPSSCRALLEPSCDRSLENDMGGLMRYVITIGFGIAVWAFCGALVGVGRQFMSMDATLIVHAIGAPIGAAVLSWLYFRNFGSTSPLVTAAIFVATALTLDLFVVALLIEKSFDMFSSIIGVWIPQALIFAATYLVGTVVTPAPTAAGKS